MFNSLSTRAKKSENLNPQKITVANQNAQITDAQDEQQIQLKKGVFIRGIKRIFFP